MYLCIIDVIEPSETISRLSRDTQKLTEKLEFILRQGDSLHLFHGCLAGGFKHWLWTQREDAKLLVGVLKEYV